MSLEEKAATVAAVDSLKSDSNHRNTTEIISRMGFFEGFRAWCEMPARLELRIRRRMA